MRHAKVREAKVCNWMVTVYWCDHTAKNQYWKFETNIPRKGIGRPQSQCPHSCVCERFTYSIFPPSICLFCCRKYFDQSREYINRSQTHACEIGTEAAEFPKKEYINGIFFAVHCQKTSPLSSSLNSSAYRPQYSRVLQGASQKILTTGRRSCATSQLSCTTP
jgi:hypothetical protein